MCFFDNLKKNKRELLKVICSNWCLCFMISIKDKSECCGCNACGDICSHRAITYQPDIEGFWYPVIDKVKCIDCGLCEKVCPVIHAEDLKSKTDIGSPECHAVQHKNLQSLFNSTSGSAFAALAEKMYKEGGYVGGAIFNEDYSVTQFISADKADLEKLRNSKYVQSNSEGFFKAVRDILKEGHKVLICGLPCQMAGMRTFLHKDYEHLIIVDLICLGINSPKILPAYLSYLEDKNNSKIIYYKAKNKELGWRNLTTKIVFENGNVVYDKKDTNYFTHGFIGTHAYARPSCYDCKFKGFPRIADITIGDLWGAEKIVGRDLDNDLGTSVVMLNTTKGRSFYNSMSSIFREKEISLGAVMKGNPALSCSLSKPIFDRTKFYKDLDEMPFEKFAKKYIHLPADRPITWKRKIKNLLRFAIATKRASGTSAYTWWQNIYYNFISRKVSANVLEGKYISINRFCILNMARHARMQIDGILNFGTKRIQGSRLETRLLIEDGAIFISKGGTISYGADIEVFPNSILELGRGIVFNINTTIICGEHIVVGDDTCFGRDVTVRDNSGNHFMSRRMFKNKRPISIGQHSWICEHAIIMPGTKIGVGVIVGAGSMVSGKLPNFTLASGSPAVVVDEEIYWKA